MIDLPVADLSFVARYHRAEILEAMGRVVDSGWFVLGTEVESFEEDFARAVGCSFGVGVGSGTDAVAIALLSCGVGPGDAVFSPTHTAVATVAAIASTGATPVLVDVEEATGNLSPDSLGEALELVVSHRPDLRPRAVVVVHLYGRPGPVDAVRPVCERHDMVLVEDAAQAHGASVRGVPVGALGDVAAFSFYPTKNLGAVGDGGMVVTGDQAIAEEARLQRQYGWATRYVSERVGRNSRLDELQAAVLRELLPHLESWNRHRASVAAHYDALMSSAPLDLPPAVPEHEVQAHHQYVIQTDDRDALASHLASRGIGTAVLYPLPVHRQSAYASRVVLAPDLTVSERVCERVLSLPMGLHVDEQAAERVAAAVLEHLDPR